MYVGSVAELAHTIGSATERALYAEQRFDEFVDSRRTPHWTIRALARQAALYECIWNSTRRAVPIFVWSPRSPTAEEQARFDDLQKKLQKIVGQLSGYGGLPLPTYSAPNVREQWHHVRDAYLRLSSRRAVEGYSTVRLLARRYALDFDLAGQARSRLSFISSELGEEAMCSLVASVRDPTDPDPNPDRRRRLKCAAASDGIP